MRGFRGGNDAFGGGEELRRLETLDLVEGRGLDQPQFLRQADQRGHAVIAQPAGMDARRHEAVPQRIHLHQRRELGRVAEIVAILAAAHGGARMRFAGDKADLAARELVAQEGEASPAKLLPPPTQPITTSGIVLGQFHLLLRLQADDRLVQQDVVQHAAQRIPGAFLADGRLDRLADGDAQAARAIGVVFQDLPGRIGFPSKGWR